MLPSRHSRSGNCGVGTIDGLDRFLDKPGGLCNREKKTMRLAVLGCVDPPIPARCLADIFGTDVGVALTPY
jgi:hypothetical protein